MPPKYVCLICRQSGFFDYHTWLVHMRSCRARRDAENAKKNGTKKR